MVLGYPHNPLDSFMSYIEGLIDIPDINFDHLLIENLISVPMGRVI